jgi:hypothetical protein
VLALNFVLVRLMHALHTRSRAVAHKAQGLSHTAAQQADRYAAQARRPVVVAQTRGAQVRATLRTLAGRSLPPESVLPEIAAQPQPERRDRTT